MTGAIWLARGPQAEAPRSDVCDSAADEEEPGQDEPPDDGDTAPTDQGLFPSCGLGALGMTPFLLLGLGGMKLAARRSRRR